MTRTQDFEDAAPRPFIHAGRTTLVYRSGREDGPDFVLLHGVGMGHAYWRGLAAELGASGTVYALDLPGFGDAPEPEEPLDMPGSGDLIAELIRGLGITRPVLIGHSMGTQLAVEAACRHPELFPELVLLAPTVNPAERTYLRQGLRLVQDMITPQLTTMYYGAIYYVKAGPRWYLKKLGTMMRHHVELRMPLIRAHTLVVRGERDRISPRGWAREVVRLIPDARLVEVPGHGHETMITGYPEVAAAIRTHLGLPDGDDLPGLH